MAQNLPHLQAYRGIVTGVLAALLLAAMAGFAPQQARAAAFPCTEAGLTSALAAGGSATFTCGVASTIIITTTKTFTHDTALDGGGLLTISGNNQLRVFTVNSGITVSLANLTVANGHATGAGGIDNNGNLTVTNSTITGNTTNGDGGGIYNIGKLSIIGSTISNNTATDYFGGGGISNTNSGTASVVNSTFTGNNAPNGDGGAIFIYSSTVTVVNSTFSANIAGGNNSSGGFSNVFGGTLNLVNTLVVNNSPRDVSGTDNTDSNNLTGGFTFASSLRNNGGPTATFALPLTSPAIDTGTCNPTYIDAVTNATMTVTTDGRGIARPQGNGCDIGAFESQGVSVRTTAGNGQTAPITTAFAAPLRVIATPIDAGVPVGAVSLTFTAPTSGASGTFAVGATSATLTTDSNGNVTAPAFTANSVAGAYPVTAGLASGAGAAATFTLTNTAGAAASITAISGNGGSAVLGSAFTAPLTVQVRDSHGNPAPNATVTFSPPTGTNIPTVTLSSLTALTDDAGIASIVATAAVRPGTLTVTASVPGASTPASFGLSNTPAATTLTLTTFSPPTGPIAGGTVVTLHGTNLGSVTGVSFGGIGGTLGASTAASLTVTTPAHLAGTVDITITTGTQTATLHGYTYLGVGSIAPQPQPSGHPPAGNVVSGGSGGSVPMAQPNRR